MLNACRPLLIFSVIANVLMLVAPLHMMQVYDRVLSSGSGSTLLYITLIGAACLMLYGLSETMRTRIAQRISASYTVKHADRLFAGMTDGSLPVERSNEITRNFNTVRTFIASRSLIGLFDLPFAPFFLLLLYLLHFQIGLVTTIGAGILIAVAWINKTSTAEDSEQAAHANSKALGFANAVASRSEDIRAMGLLPAVVERWGSLTGESLNAQDISTKKTAMFFGISKAVRQILQITIMAWGAWLVLSGDMSGGMIFAASMVSGRALQPIEQVIGAWDSINRARSAHEGIEAVLAEADDRTGRIRQPEAKGQLTVSGASLSVKMGDKDMTILNNVSFSLEPGNLLAIIGPSGAGKSTLARIVAGALPPSAGEIMLDGCLQANWPTGQWGESVGYVGQDILLFPGTIAENIARMSLRPDEQKIIRAASLAGAHQMINAFPQGYMTVIGDGNLRLSGGQKQRIALARALYTSPKLLVLDEPNAHLDLEGTQILTESLKAIKSTGAAILVVTQRKQILSVADDVMLIKNGTRAPIAHDQVKAAANAGKNTEPRGTKDQVPGRPQAGTRPAPPPMVEKVLKRA